MLRAAALNIVTALGVEGGCNVPVRPQTGQHRIRGHRGQSPGVPLLRPGLQGHRLPHRQGGRPRSPSATRLDEIVNAVTGKTYACFEPAVDYMRGQVPQMAL